MTNQLTVTLVAVFLGVLSIASLGITGWLIHGGVSDAVLLLAISSPGSTALGGLIGLLSNASVRPAGPAPPLPGPHT